MTYNYKPLVDGGNDFCNEVQQLAKYMYEKNPKTQFLLNKGVGFDDLSTSVRGKWRRRAFDLLIGEEI